jgi:kynurenine formamidase
LVSWKSRKQQTVALSTCEAEYIALAEAVREGKFLRQLCLDLKVLQVSNSILVNVDNQGAIQLAKNPVFHKRSKHIDIKYHFIRSELELGTINVKYVASEDNLADIFTKPVGKTKLDKFKFFICN